MLGRRRLLHGVAAVSALAATGRPLLAQVSDGGREAMARAATAFLAALDARQRRRAVFAFTDSERRNWHYVPRRREGVALKEMPSAARAAAHELMRGGLSAVGYAKAVNVMRLEEVLRELETFGSLLRDPENYAVTVFGDPGSESAWGWRLEGHHLSLNFTLVPGRPIAVTPAFIGANPALVPRGPRKGLRALEEEQDLGLALARAVGPGLQSRLVIAAESLGDIVSGPGRGESLSAPAGVALGELGPEARALALRLIGVYARNMHDDLAEEQLRRLRDAGIEQVHFAWAGPVDPRRAHYYRLHGPTLLIEYDNTQNDANHIHSVWHDPRNDFGADLLRTHYRSHRHHHRA
jgi:hypothetical protein